jgi:hypothetical protein
MSTLGPLHDELKDVSRRGMDMGSNQLRGIHGYGLGVHGFSSLEIVKQVVGSDRQNWLSSANEESHDFAGWHSFEQQTLAGLEVCSIREHVIEDKHGGFKRT